MTESFYVFPRLVRACSVAIAPLSLAIFGAITQPVLADVSLPRLLNDGAILQHGKPVPIWGFADEGEKVEVTFANKTLSTTAVNGQWKVLFPAQKAGSEHSLTVRGKNTLERKGLLMGDLWLSAGQSNMELPINRVATRYPDLIASTQLPSVREFNVPTLYNVEGPQKDYEKGEWAAATPDNLGRFSAVGFFYTRKLWQDTGIPQGIITVPVGGSPIEAWLSQESLAKYPDYLQKLTQYQVPGALAKRLADDKTNSDNWYNQLHERDLGVKGGWESPSVSDADWRAITLPGFIRNQDLDLGIGSFWVSKTIYLTPEQAAKAATLWLGCIVDGDHTYINGTLVGSISYQYPPRIYTVPAGLLKAGENHIRVRVTTYSNNPGFVTDKPYKLDLGDESIVLTGTWKYKEAATMDAQKGGLTAHYIPASLYNAKVAPSLPLPIKGVLWYQGESNVGRTRAADIAPLPSHLCKHESCAGTTDEYRYLLTDLIAQYRKDFNNPKLPVYFVQLANFLAAQDNPSESGWAQTREAQRQTLAVAHTGMAVTIDVGEWNDIHPLNKQSVGERLALQALTQTYGKRNLVANGPELTRITRKGESLELKFSSVGKGLTVSGDHVKEIAIAGDDKKFVWANARVSKDSIVVTAKGVKTPRWVRYAWADNPANANLYNSEQLPASPFEAYID
jgi:sialate O-acetylesterase